MFEAFFRKLRNIHAKFLLSPFTLLSTFALLFWNIVPCFLILSVFCFAFSAGDRKNRDKFMENGKISNAIEYLTGELIIWDIITERYV